MNENVILNMLLNKYNKLMLSKKECANELGVSISTLDRMRKEGIGLLPISNKLGNCVYYSIEEIAKFLSNK